MVLVSPYRPWTRGHAALVTRDKIDILTRAACAPADLRDVHRAPVARVLGLLLPRRHPPRPELHRGQQRVLHLGRGGENICDRT